MTYDEMVTRIAAARDGAQALREATSDPELMAIMTDDQIGSMVLLAEELRICFLQILDVEDGRTRLIDDFFTKLMSGAPKLTAVLMLKSRLGDPETEKPNKALALELAEVLGPDWAQVLYRLSVLVTKVA